MFQNIALPLHPQIAKQGALTKRLCGGLQNRIEQFDSATHLLTNPQVVSKNACGFSISKIIRPNGGFCKKLLIYGDG